MRIEDSVSASTVGKDIVQKGEGNKKSPIEVQGEIKNLNEEAKKVYKNTIKEILDLGDENFDSEYEKIDLILKKFDSFMYEDYPNKFNKLLEEIGTTSREEITKNMPEAVEYSSIFEEMEKLRFNIATLSSIGLDASKKREKEQCWNNLKSLNKN
jgi:hypothetical protein